MSLSDSLFQNLIKQTEEKAIKLKYLCPKTGLEKQSNKNASQPSNSKKVQRNITKNVKPSSNHTKDIVDLTANDLESDPLDPLATNDIVISDCIPIGITGGNTSFQGKGKKSKGSQKLFENTIKFGAPNLSTDDLENIVHGAKKGPKSNVNQKTTQQQKAGPYSQKKPNNNADNLTVPPLKIKLGHGKNKNVVIPVPAKKKRNELDMLIDAFTPLAQTSTNRPSRSSIMPPIIDLDSDGEMEYQTKKQIAAKNIPKVKKDESKNTAAIPKKTANNKISMSRRNKIKIVKFKKNLKIRVKRMSLKKICRLTRATKKQMHSVKPRNSRRNPARASFPSSFPAPSATSSPKKINTLTRRSLQNNDVQKAKKSDTSQQSPQTSPQKQTRSKLFFKLNTIPLAFSKKRKFEESSSSNIASTKPVQSLKQNVRRTTNSSPISVKSTAKNVRFAPKKLPLNKKKPSRITKTPLSKNKIVPRNNQRSLKKLPSKKKIPLNRKTRKIVETKKVEIEKIIDPKNFEQPYLIERFGKQFFKCHVKMPKIKKLEGNTTVADWESYEEQKIQKRKEKRRGNLNKSVSFLETVEIFGESETSASESEDETIQKFQYSEDEEEEITESENKKVETGSDNNLEKLITEVENSEEKNEISISDHVPNSQKDEKDDTNVQNLNEISEKEQNQMGAENINTDLEKLNENSNQLDIALEESGVEDLPMQENIVNVEKDLPENVSDEVTQKEDEHKEISEQQSLEQNEEAIESDITEENQYIDENIIKENEKVDETVSTVEENEQSSAKVDKLVENEIVLEKVDEIQNENIEIGQDNQETQVAQESENAQELIIKENLALQENEKIIEKDLTMEDINLVDDKSSATKESEKEIDEDVAEKNNEQQNELESSETQNENSKVVQDVSSFEENVAEVASHDEINNKENEDSIKQLVESTEEISVREENKSIADENIDIQEEYSVKNDSTENILDKHNEKDIPVRNDVESTEKNITNSNGLNLNSNSEESTAIELTLDDTATTTVTDDMDSTKQTDEENDKVIGRKTHRRICIRKIRTKRYFSPLKSDESPRSKTLRNADEKIVRPPLSVRYEVFKSEKQLAREAAKLKREKEKQELKEKRARERQEQLEKRRKEREEAKLLKKLAKESGEEEYVVERIEGKKRSNGRVKYYIKWAGYSREDNTWEPEKNIVDKDLIKEFEDDLKEGKLKLDPKTSQIIVDENEEQIKTVTDADKLTTEDNSTDLINTIDTSETDRDKEFAIQNDESNKDFENDSKNVDNTEIDKQSTQFSDDFEKPTANNESEIPSKENLQHVDTQANSENEVICLHNETDIDMVESTDKIANADTDISEKDMVAADDIEKVDNKERDDQGNLKENEEEPDNYSNIIINEKDDGSPTGSIDGSPTGSMGQKIDSHEDEPVQRDSESDDKDDVNEESLQINENRSENDNKMVEDQESLSSDHSKDFEDTVNESSDSNLTKAVDAAIKAVNENEQEENSDQENLVQLENIDENLKEADEVNDVNEIDENPEESDENLSKKISENDKNEDIQDQDDNPRDDVNIQQEENDLSQDKKENNEDNKDVDQINLDDIEDKSTINQSEEDKTDDTEHDTQPEFDTDVETPNIQKNQSLTNEQDIEGTRSLSTDNVHDDNEFENTNKIIDETQKTLISEDESKTDESQGTLSIPFFTKDDVCEEESNRETSLERMLATTEKLSTSPFEQPRRPELQVSKSTFSESSDQKRSSSSERYRKSRSPPSSSKPSYSSSSHKSSGGTSSSSSKFSSSYSSSKSNRHSPSPSHHRSQPSHSSSSSYTSHSSSSQHRRNQPYPSSSSHRNAPYPPYDRNRNQNNSRSHQHHQQRNYSSGGYSSYYNRYK